MDILKNIKQLNTTGRAFKSADGSNIKLLHESLSDVFQDLFDSIKSIYNGLLPDNDLFDESDATIWENRLGLIGSGTLEERKQAISRKLNYPNGVLGRMSLNYFQWQLNLAGFDVFVHANKFDDGNGGYMVINPGDGTGSYTQHGVAEHGVDVHGTTGFPYDSIIANYTDKTLEDTPTYTNEELRATFFIGGETFPNFASVPAEREEEFRKLILTLKGQHLVGYLLINYS